MGIIAGVVRINSASYILEDYDNVVDLSYCISFDNHIAVCEDSECIEEDHDLFKEDWYPDNSIKLIGFKKSKNEKECWYWLPSSGYGFVPDTEAKYSAILGEVYAQIVQSKYYSLCAYCSPCYPNQGDLNTEGYSPSYQLPPEVYDEHDTHLEILLVK